ncbi:MAG: UDP-N-acetylmuramoyl-tripeptide--D-alanyl-D-alanine ligase [Frankiaceae bacterium]|nr:UDP-N-acetylmuramoyl-tripeptide--D-alanyl-D-alanine ligase [Frankiaceae bacterium]
MIPLRLDAVAAATNGRLAGGADPAALVDAVVTDSRAAGPGSLFVAIDGEHHDGHDFAAAAITTGATAVLAGREVGAPAVVVQDSVAALGNLARHALEQLPQVTVIGITGSAGKTTTKDLLGGVLARAGATIAPVGSFNNEIGHPLTVLRADAGTRYLVLECSARGIGHIAHLCRIAPPHIGVVLNVGTAHVGVFGGQDAIAQAKGELVEALPHDGVAILNGDDPRVAAMAARTDARVVTVGATGTYRAEALTMTGGRASFRLETPGGSIPVQLSLYGEHMVGNVLAAAAVAVELGMALDDVAQALSAAVPVSRWRMEVTTRADGLTVINDAYNANPDSMSAALRALMELAGPRRTWAVLGLMGELGDGAAEAHSAVGRYAASLGVTEVLAVGEGAAEIAAGAARGGTRARTVPDTGAAVALLLGEATPGDVVLVKGSRVAGLESVAAALAEEVTG